MKRIKFNQEAMKAVLESNKKRAQKSRVTIEENPILKVEGPGDYNFRATYYPHNEDPAAEPFLTRHYHFGIEGTGIFYCPQENEGKDCAICDFVWDRMKETKGTDAAKMWGSKLPKMRVWIPGKLRGEREDEGWKFFSFGSRQDKPSRNHDKIMKWFFNPKTESWLSPDDDGIDMIISYEEYEPSKAKMLNASFGLEGVSLDRDSSPFGKEGEFETFMKEIPNIDIVDLPVLSSYNRKTSEEAEEALQKWRSRLDKKNKSFSSRRLDSKTSEISTESDNSKNTSEENSEKKASAVNRLKKLGYNLEL